ncbi:TIGR04376 family protein [Cyanobacterium stanieri LEGE 03274]|uniref:TIGR04376 family protein n=1 Tax=Cyanobacterium stanieri LEGE 03274 TaxID=1828756 RepID=A0ABR9V452_9CHRO|nr:TIGR04376 family protein [Cyanobacterium stanieri]MBE9222673.1 TIGR04376 family protein [Cyanobacterium stanieri LEGE 03274]
MGIFEDFSNFLESRLEEFLNSNPKLKLEVLSEELIAQEKETIKLILRLKAEQKKLEQEIIDLGQEIQKWHPRIEKARQSGRYDLAQEAEMREISLLQQGKIAWEKMEDTKKKIIESREILSSIEDKQKEVKLKMKQTQYSYGSSQSYNYSSPQYTTYTDNLDPLEQKFREWEVDQELKDMRQN